MKLSWTLASAPVIAAAIAAAVPAQAAEPAPAALSIATGDLNLATAEGQRALDQRIEKAVRGVCAVNGAKTGTRLTSPDARACLAKARADARRQVAELSRSPIGDRQRGG